MNENALARKPLDKVAELLSLANLSRNGKAEALTSGEWTVAAELIVKDYPEMRFETLSKIISNGVKGEYDSDAAPFVPINVRTIYRWIRAHLAAEKAKPKDANAILKKLKQMGWIPVWRKHKQPND